MKKFNESRREKQLEWLDKCDTRESRQSFSRPSIYLIKADNGMFDTCQCAGTAVMLLNTKYLTINVWLTKRV